MALIACRECSKEISSEAPACPHCGCPKAFDATCRHCHRPVESDAQVCPHCFTLEPARASKRSVGRALLIGGGTLLGLFVVLVVVGVLRGPASRSAEDAHVFPEPARIAMAAIADAGHPCGDVLSTATSANGSMRATCSNGETYRIFQLGGKMVAMRCSAARQLGVDGC